MFIAGVVAVASLVGILAALFGAGIGLAYWDRSLDKYREH